MQTDHEDKLNQSIKRVNLLFMAIAKKQGTQNTVKEPRDLANVHIKNDLYRFKLVSELFLSYSYNIIVWLSRLLTRVQGAVSRCVHLPGLFLTL